MNRRQFVATVDTPGVTGVAGCGFGGSDGPTNVAHQIPSRDGSTTRSVEYTWEPWNRPDATERLKRSYHVLRERLS